MAFSSRVDSKLHEHDIRFYLSYNIKIIWNRIGVKKFFFFSPYASNVVMDGWMSLNNVTNM